MKLSDTKQNKEFIEKQEIIEKNIDKERIAEH